VQSNTYCWRVTRLVTAAWSLRASDLAPTSGYDCHVGNTRHRYRKVAEPCTFFHEQVALGQIEVVWHGPDDRMNFNICRRPAIR
jgi:hypothetical protein